MGKKPKCLPNKEERRRLLALMEALDWMFSITNFDRTLHYMHEADDSSPDCIAEVSVTREYQRITISIYPKFWELDAEKQRKALLHEYCHSETEPLQHQAEALRKGHLVTEKQVSEAVEEVTSRMENHLDALLRGRKKFMRDAYAAYLKKKKRKKR
jgi:hypothetical protein